MKKLIDTIKSNTDIPTIIMIILVGVMLYMDDPIKSLNIYLWVIGIPALIIFIFLIKTSFEFRNEKKNKNIVAPKRKSLLLSRIKNFTIQTLVIIGMIFVGLIMIHTMFFR